MGHNTISVTLRYAHLARGANWQQAKRLCDTCSAPEEPTAPKLAPSDFVSGASLSKAERTASAQQLIQSKAGMDGTGRRSGLKKLRLASTPNGEVLFFLYFPAHPNIDRK